MNIFALDRDAFKAAEYHCNTHANKMILEHCQMLSTALHVAYGHEALSFPIYKKTHQNHPSAIWSRRTKGNYIHLVQMTQGLLNRFRDRTDREHASSSVLFFCAMNFSKIPDGPLEEFSVAIPESHRSICAHSDPVESYRRYYVTAKNHIAYWDDVPIPNWFSHMHFRYYTTGSFD